MTPKTKTFLQVRFSLTDPTDSELYEYLSQKSNLSGELKRLAVRMLAIERMDYFRSMTYGTTPAFYHEGQGGQISVAPSLPVATTPHPVHSVSGPTGPPPMSGASQKPGMVARPKTPARAKEPVPLVLREVAPAAAPDTESIPEQRPVTYEEGGASVDISSNGHFVIRGSIEGDPPGDDGFDTDLVRM